MAYGNYIPKVDLDSEIRHLHERVAAVGAQTAEFWSSHRDLAVLLDQLSIAVWMTDERLVLTATRGTTTAVLLGAGVGASLSELLDESDPRVSAARMALDGQESRSLVFSGDRMFSLCVRPVREGSGAVTGTFASAVEITEQHRRQQALIQSEQRYRDLIENAADLILTHDPEGRLTSVNKSVERVLGYTRAQALTMRLHDLMAPEYRATLEDGLNALRMGAVTQTREVVALTAAGRRVVLELNMRLMMRNNEAVGFECIARDLTERRGLEDQVRQSQKMEAIGVLAGGIAHDFNNLLTGVLGYAYLIQSEPNLDPRMAESVNVIVKSAERAAQLTTQLLGFARRSKEQNIAVDVHSVIREVVAQTGRNTDPRIRIVTALGAPSPHVMGDPAQIQQLLTNLWSNARDAMAAGGTLTISTRLAGANVVLSVADTGEGIRPEIRERVFEPFFTTKGPDKGTGMGLALVYGITRNHGGTVHLQSELGVGTTVHVSLPMCAQPVVEIRVPQAQPPRGAGRVLVIDDEEVVRQVLSRLLDGLGYEVVAFGDSPSGVEYYRQNAGQIQAVIVDMVMPAMSGRDVYYALREVNPDVRVLLSSGYSRDDSAEELARTTGIEFLQKPYQIDQLANALRRTLSRTASAR